MKNVISKRFGNKVVLNDVEIDFDINSISLLIGKNGAGKTTLFKILNGLIRKYEGCFDNRKYVMLEDEPAFFYNKTGLENLKFFLKHNEIIVAEKYIEIFDMTEYINSIYKTYSQGMRKKLAIVLAFAQESDVILLDEPTNGLDVDTVGKLKESLKLLKKTKTIVVSSHDTSFFDRELIDHVLSLSKGFLKEITTKFFDYAYYLVETEEEPHNNIVDIIERRGVNKYCIKVKVGSESQTSEKLCAFKLKEFKKIEYGDKLYTETLLC